MGTLTSKPVSRHVITAVLVLVAVVLILEKFAIGSHVYSAVKSAHDTPLSGFLFNFGKAISRTLVLAAIIFLILIQSKLASYRTLFVTQYRITTCYFLIAQLIIFALFYACTNLAFRTAGSLQYAYQMLWVILGIALAFLTLGAIGSIPFWQRIISEQKWPLLIALGLSSGVWWLSSATQGLWTHFADFTFYLVAECLFWFSDDVYSDPANRIIGVGKFLVNIDTQCSGYEGIGLVLAFVFVFLYTFKQDFRFPRALLLFPIGAVIIWLFNIVRIVVLVMIGSLWSKEVAIWGFHTQAGWITFILTSVGLMWMAHNSSFFATIREPRQAFLSNINLPIATLLPLIALLAMTFITKALSGQFDWLYPARVLVVAAVFLYCFKELDLLPLSWNYRSFIGGILVAIIWILMVKPDSEVDMLYSTTFQQSEQWIVVMWLAFRFIGSAVTVPIAEELGFRSYLLCRLSSQPVVNRGNIAFSAVGCVTSSVAFGLLHGAWIEGTIAGLVYAWVRYRSQHIMDAVMAHGITNALLFIFVMYSGEWSML